MRNQFARSYVTTMMLLLSILLSACGPGDGGSHADLVAFNHLIANAQSAHVLTHDVVLMDLEGMHSARSSWQHDHYPQGSVITFDKILDVRGDVDSSRPSSDLSIEAIL